MSFCNSMHVPIYKIKYKPDLITDESLEWYVCEDCFGKKDFFGSPNEIEFIVSLKNSYEITHHIENLSVMTKFVTSKLRKNLKENSVISS